MLLRPTAVAFGLALLFGAWPAPPLTPPADAAAAQPPATTYAQLPSAARAAVSRSVGRGQERFSATALVDGAALFQGSSFTARVAGSTMHIAPEGGPGWSLRLAGWGRADALAGPALGPVATDQNEARFAGSGIDAWWVHGPGGLEQGWTARERPDGDGPLLLDLRLSGIVTVEIDPDGRAATLIDGEGARHRYAGLWAADAAGRDLSATMSPGNAFLTITVDDGGAVYPITIDPWIEVAGLTRGAGSADSDFLGYSVAISADGSTIAAGAIRDDTGGADRGRVDVFVRPASGWGTSMSPAAKLTRAAGSANLDQLGWSVAISADGSTIAAGAQLDDTGGSNRGRVDVFVRPAGGWADSTVPNASLARATGSANDDNLGTSVAISADGSTIAAGAPFDDTGGGARGRVDVFVRPGGGWADSAAPTAKLTRAAGSADGDQLGFSVAVSADGATIAAGARLDDTGGLNRGRVDVFVRPGGGWADSDTPNAKLTRSSGTNGDELGTSISISADGATIAAGALFDHTGGSNRGRVDVFVRPGGGWADSSAPNAKLTRGAGSNDGDQLGYSVAISADGATIAAGAWLDDTGGVNRGRVDVFVRPGGGWADSSAPNAKLTRAAGSADDDWLGWSVAISADGATIAAGAFRDDTAGTDRGRVQVFQSGVGGWADTTVPAAKLHRALGSANSDLLGWSVAMSADGSTIAAGAPNDLTGGTDRGRVDVFVRPPSGWADSSAPTAKLTRAAGGAAEDQMGYSVAISADGSTIAAGAPYDDTGGTNRGRVDVFVRPSGGWTDSAAPTAKLTGGADGDLLGSSVAISADGATIAAGAPNDDTGGTNRGRADVFVRPSGGWTDTTTPNAKLTRAAGSADNDILGSSVAISADGATIAAGAPQYNPGGRVDVFVRPGATWFDSIAPNAKLTRAVGTDNGDHIGRSVAISADGATIAAGAPGDDTAGSGRGRVDVFVRPGGGWADSSAPNAKLTRAAGIVLGEFIGWSVAISADGATIAAGAPGGFTGGTNRGRADVFVRPGGGWADSTVPNARLARAAGSANDDRLGSSVAISADGATIAAGARYNETGGSDGGRVDVFPLAQGFFFGPTSGAARAAITIPGWNLGPNGVVGVRFGAGPQVAPTTNLQGYLIAAIPLGSASGSVELIRADGGPAILLPGFTYLKTAQSIAFATLAASIPGDTRTASAPATSGLGVTFASLTPAVCAVSGNTVTALAPGTCTIQADQPGNGDYFAATAQQSFTVGLFRTLLPVALAQASPF